MPVPSDAGAAASPSDAPGEAPLFTLAHASDIHFGAIDDVRVVDALVADVNAAGVDLVCLSGDLTQRARVREFAAARALMARFEAPVVVVPGNHDTYQWWHPVRRLVRPLRRYQHEISDDLTPRFETTGEGGAALAVLGINSAHGRTRKGGRISSTMRAAIASFFPAREGAFKVLVLHHHLTRLHALGHHDVSRKASATLALAQSVGVDLILCGHLHISHVEAVETAGQGGRRLVIASAGTATSTRGRGQHRLTNFYNRIRVYADRFDVVECRFDGETGAFAAVHTRTFPRV